MKTQFSRRGALTKLGGAIAGLFTLSAARAAKAAVQKVLVSSGAPKDYDPTKHKWLMCIDVNKCIGCGLCVEACKKENAVPEGPYFRTWIERYVIIKPERRLGPDARRYARGFPQRRHAWLPRTALCRRQKFEHSFFVPKLCNLCKHSPCVQVCPVGASFDSPDGAVLVDPRYCIGCGFCIQACPYGCRFLSPVTHTAEKCTLCYHRITRGLKPACVEICPTQARIFGDLKNRGAGRPHPEILREQPGAGAQAASGHGTPRPLRRLDKEVR